MQGLVTIADIVARYQMTLGMGTYETHPAFVNNDSILGLGQGNSVSKPRIERTEDQYELEQQFRISVIKLYKKVLEYQMKAASYLNKGTLVRIVRNLPKVDDWTGMLAAISRLDTECGRYESIAHSKDLNLGFKSILQSFQDREKRLEELIIGQNRKEQAALKLVNLVSADMVGQDHEDVRSRLGSQYWGSGQWLLRHDHYTGWRESNSDVLWLRGLVGAGKTCLASIVIQECLSNSIDEKIAFFYCSQQQKESAVDALRFGSCEPVDVLRSLLAQMSCDTGGDISLPLRTWLEQRIGFVSGENMFPALGPSINRQMSFVECVDLLVETIRLQGPTTLIVDALDECRDPYELLTCLESIQHQTAGVKIFLTSRFSIQNDMSFTSARVISKFDSAADIEAFINRELNARERKSRSGMTATQAAEFQNLLASRADGMYVNPPIHHFSNHGFDMSTGFAGLSFRLMSF